MLTDLSVAIYGLVPPRPPYLSPASGPHRGPIAAARRPPLGPRRPYKVTLAFAGETGGLGQGDGSDITPVFLMPFGHLALRLSGGL